MGKIYKNGIEYGGGGSDTGGHEILDTDGSSMPAEDKLQFKGLDVTDNSTDGITEVEAFGLNADDLAELSTQGISTGFVQTQFNYSTEEQVIGKWIDGKPIYQKTIQATAPTPSGSTPGISYISLGVSVGKLIGYHGMLAANDGIDVPFGCFAYAEGLNVYVYENTATDTQRRNTVRFMNGNSAWAGLGAYITVQYTKATN